MKLSALLLAAFACLSGAVSEEPARPTIAEFLGLNGHFHFRPELYRPCTGLVRNYHNINWDVSQPGDPLTLPVAANKVNWATQVYGPWQAAGHEISLCAQFGRFGEKNDAYRALWAGREDWIRGYGEALARHFGRPGQGSVGSIEIGNEPGADFDDALYQRLFRAMAAGIRSGDPTMRIVTCTAQARAADKYAKDLRQTFTDPAMLELVDVLNVHSYAQLRDTSGTSPWTRTFPESDETDYLQLIDEVIAWRDQHAPAKAVWVTEFGYDACTPAAMQQRKGWFEKLDWQGVSDLQQAQYLLRSVLLFAARDLERAYIYFYDDKDTAQVHGCAGLTRNFEPKPAYHAIAQLQRLLGEYRFARVVAQEAGERYVYAFAHRDDADRRIWVAWSPTGVRTDQREGYEPRSTTIRLLELPGPVERVVEMATAAGVDRERAFEHLIGGISLTIDESPCYILFTE